MSILDRPELERLRYRQGQALLGRDFRRGVALHDQARWWHNRGAHNAYGIASGLSVAGDPVTGLVVSPGLAYDCSGRELWLQRSRTAPLPHSAAKQPEIWTLLLRYRPSSGFVVVGRGCAPAPDDFGELHWKHARQVAIAEGVPLARFRAIATPSGTLYERDLGFRPPLLRPLARPRLGHGATVQGKTAWTHSTGPFGVSFPGIEVAVDTSASGFDSTPCYFAWLRGQPWRLAAGGILPLLLDRIRAATPHGFTFRLWQPQHQGAPGIFFSNKDFGLLELARRFLGVCWLGIQMPSVPEEPDTPQEVDHGKP